MGGGPALLDGSLAARNSFQEPESVLKGFVGDHIHQIGGGDSVLGDKDRGLVFCKLSENLAGIPLQCGHQLGFHKSDTKVSPGRLQPRNPSW